MLEKPVRCPLCDSIDDEICVFDSIAGFKQHLKKRHNFPSIAQYYLLKELEIPRKKEEKERKKIKKTLGAL